MNRYALIKLREATADDFKNSEGKSKIGAVYFCKNSNGIIEKKINYISLEHETNKIVNQEFKQLFEAKQIYVFANPNEAENVSVMDYRELDVVFETISPENEIEKPDFTIREWVADWGVFSEKKQKFIGKPLPSYPDALMVLNWLKMGIDNKEINS